MLSTWKRSKFIPLHYTTPPPEPPSSPIFVAKCKAVTHGLLCLSLCPSLCWGYTYYFCTVLDHWNTGVVIFFVVILKFLINFSDPIISSLPLPNTADSRILGEPGCFSHTLYTILHPACKSTDSHCCAHCWVESVKMGQPSPLRECLLKYAAELK